MPEDTLPETIRGTRAGSGNEDRRSGCGAPSSRSRPAACPADRDAADHRRTPARPSRRPVNQRCQPRRCAAELPTAASSRSGCQDAVRTPSHQLCTRTSLQTRPAPCECALSAANEDVCPRRAMYKHKGWRRRSGHGRTIVRLSARLERPDAQRVLRVRVAGALPRWALRGEGQAGPGRTGSAQAGEGSLALVKASCGPPGGLAGALGSATGLAQRITGVLGMWRS